MTKTIIVDEQIQIEIEYDKSEVYPPSHYAENFVRILGQQPLKGLRILDVGCGTGVLGITAAKKGAQVVCSDLNPGAVEWTKKNALRNGVEMHCEVSEGLEAFLGKPKFDLVICNAPSNPGTYNPIVTPRDNGPNGRHFLDSVLLNATKILNRNGRLLSCSNSEQDWNATRNILNSHWASYKIVADLDENFDGLDQFSTEQLEAWVGQGHCWIDGDQTIHNVRYFFAYH